MKSLNEDISVEMLRDKLKGEKGKRKYLGRCVRFTIQALKNWLELRLVKLHLSAMLPLQQGLKTF
ncbi:MAG: hypothetical protein IPO94_17900 [Saprospiraceae bacterium]|nr:hypothetical protein [Saprospiraceae bacterium]